MEHIQVDALLALRWDESALSYIDQLKGDEGYASVIENREVMTP